MSVRLESICPPAPARRIRASTRLPIQWSTPFSGLRCSEDVAGRVSWDAMRSATRSPSPVRVGDVLLAAVPALEERLLAERIRLGWRAAVGADLSRRSRPGELKGGTLTIMVDNSPWLQELSMRSAEVLSAVRARFGPSVTALRLSLAGPAPSPERPARRATPPTGSSRLDPDETALVESALAPVQDADLASTVRRLMSKDLIARRPRGSVALALGGTVLAAALAGG